MGAREDILDAIQGRVADTGCEEFTIQEIVEAMADSEYEESTIRTHISSRMCGDAPDHHQTTYDDLERVRRGVYRLK